MATIIVSDWASFITAVGTAGADVEFPKQLRKTRDRDVDANKLYLDANGIVQTNVQPSDLRNLYENTFVLDANDYAPAGLAATITINCNSINGFGGYILNLASLTVDLFTIAAQNVTISQLAILNIGPKDNYFINESYPVSYYKCLFSGRLTNDTNTLVKAFGGTGTHRSTFESCSFNLQIYGRVDIFNKGANDAGALVEYCRVELNIEDHPGTGGTLYVQAINSYFTGQCLDVYTGYFTDGSAYSIVEINCEYGTMSLDWYSTNINLVLVNTDVFKGYFSDTRYTAVTDATLSSAAALNALGFAVQT